MEKCNKTEITSLLLYYTQLSFVLSKKNWDHNSQHVHVLAQPHAADACWGCGAGTSLILSVLSWFRPLVQLNAWMNNAVGLLSGHCHAGPKGTWALANQCSLLTRLVHSWAWYPQTACCSYAEPTSAASKSVWVKLTGIGNFWELAGAWNSISSVNRMFLAVVP
jgi:hypothetical protein